MTMTDQCDYHLHDIAQVLYDKADNGLKAANPWEGKCVILNLIIQTIDM